MMFPDNIQRAIVADKIAARGYAAERIGPEHNIEIYDICDSPEALIGKNYPYPYVVKTNHASGLIALVFNNADRQKMLKDVQRWNPGEHKPKTEWAYHGIKRKFIVEKLLQQENKTEATEFYIYYFFGKPVLQYIVVNRATKPKKAFLTPDWQRLDLEYNYEMLTDIPEKPANLDEIHRLGRLLSPDFDFIRVDFMLVENQIFFGELTNFPAAGQMLHKPYAYDKYLLAEYNRIRKNRIDQTRANYHTHIEQNLHR